MIFTTILIFLVACYRIGSKEMLQDSSLEARRLFEEKPIGPTYFPLGELLDNWNPDDVSFKNWLASKAHPSKGSSTSIARFDYSNEEQRNLALKFRNAELPFVLNYVPEVKSAAKLWTDSYLMQQINTPRKVEMSTTNHFMYYKKKRDDFEESGSESSSKWKAPQEDVIYYFKQWKICDE